MIIYSCGLITFPSAVRRIQVSTTKKPLFFYVNLAKVRRCFTSAHMQMQLHIVPENDYGSSHEHA